MERRVRTGSKDHTDCKVSTDHTIGTGKASMVNKENTVCMERRRAGRACTGSTGHTDSTGDNKDHSRGSRASGRACRGRRV